MKNFLMDESGATAIEYGLIAAAIGLMLIVIMPTVSASLKNTFTKVNSGLVNFNGKSW
jgi:pilus assembly protein Flp/PilA